MARYNQDEDIHVVDVTTDTGGQAGGLIAILSLLAGLAWLVGAGAAGLALLGAERVAVMGPLEWAALAFIVLMPALIIWLAGAAARESARTRAQANRLADAADRMMNPSPVAEMAARKLGVSIRGEISALERALDITLAKLQDVDGVVTRQSDAVDRAARLAQENAGALISGLEKERSTLMAMTADLAQKADAIAAAIARQSEAIAAAASRAGQELHSVDAMLADRLSTFGASSALIGDRTKALTAAANATHQSAHRLEKALADSLDSLAKATDLTDAAKQSAQEATLAASATAGAVRETTQRAVEDARRAADYLRNESAAIERDAAAAIQRLRSAAGTSQAPAPAGAPVSSLVPAPTQQAEGKSQGASGSRAFFFSQPAGSRLTQKNVHAESGAPATAAAIEAETSGQKAPAQTGFGDQMTGFRPRAKARTEADTWSWRDMLGEANAESETLAGELSQRSQAKAPGFVGFPPGRIQLQLNPFETPRPMLARTNPPKVESGAHAPLAPPRSGHPLAVVDMIEQAGVRFDNAFSVASLDRIASRARNGTQARRRAVRDAAPDAVDLIGAHLALVAAARQEAALFQSREGARIADLLGRGRASMSADATRAFLLIDAASV